MVTELGGSVFEITHDLIGDFRAKNAGVTEKKNVSALHKSVSESHKPNERDKNKREDKNLIMLATKSEMRDVTQAKYSLYLCTKTCCFQLTT
jgi:hypothetical protein